MTMDDCEERVWRGIKLQQEAPPGVYRRCNKDGSPMSNPRDGWHFLKTATGELYWLDKRGKKFMEPIASNWGFMSYRRVKEVK